MLGRDFRIASLSVRKTIDTSEIVLLIGHSVLPGNIFIFLLAGHEVHHYLGLLIASGGIDYLHYIRLLRIHYASH